MRSVLLGNTTPRLLVKHFPFHRLLGALGRERKEKEKKKEDRGRRTPAKLKMEFEA